MNRPPFLRLFITVAVLVVIMQNRADAGAITCDIERSSCMQTTAEGIKIEFDLQPKPVTAMTDLNIIVSLSQRNTPLADVSVQLDLSMPGMFMGVNKPVLRHTGAGRYEGKTVITRCVSGRKTWNARIDVKGQHETTAADFQFEVK